MLYYINNTIFRFWWTINSLLDFTICSSNFEAIFIIFEDILYLSPSFLRSFPYFIINLALNLRNCFDFLSLLLSFFDLFSTSLLLFALLFCFFFFFAISNLNWFCSSFSIFLLLFCYFLSFSKFFTIIFSLFISFSISIFFYFSIFISLFILL